MSEELQELYRTSRQDVRGRGVAAEEAAALYGDYLKFVAAAAPPPGRLLDAGCGNGWSSELFCQQGYHATGIDLNAAFFEPTPRPGLELREASVLVLPFPDQSFDVVAANQMLEHVPGPAAALLEMLRVLRNGGTLCIVGPNLLSPLQPLRGMARYAWRNRPLRRILLRDAGMPRHPGGNTLPENMAACGRNIGRIIQLACSGGARFEMREPDMTPPFHSDNDACYLCNPLDVVKFVRSRGCRVLRNGKPGRPPFTSALAAGTWVAARKPAG